jgi:hypothetical protein
MVYSYLTFIVQVILFAWLQPSKEIRIFVVTLACVIAVPFLPTMPDEYDFFHQALASLARCFGVKAPKKNPAIRALNRTFRSRSRVPTTGDMSETTL